LLIISDYLTLYVTPYDNWHIYWLVSSYVVTCVCACVRSSLCASVEVWLIHQLFKCPTFAHNHVGNSYSFTPYNESELTNSMPIQLRSQKASRLQSRAYNLHFMYCAMLLVSGRIMNRLIW